MRLTATEYFSLRAEEIDAAIETSFYGRLKMRNGTFKLTKSARFPDIDTALAQTFRARAKALRTVLDVGVSTGITTVEFSDFLRSVGASPHIVATDLFIDGHIVQLLNGVRVLTDSTAWPLEYDIFGHPVRPWIARRDYITTTAFFRWVARAALRPRLTSMIRRGQSRPVKFLSHRLSGRGDISVLENDIFSRSDSFVGRFDLVRVANVLNRSYFAEDDIMRAVDTIRAYLRPGGAFLVTRTESNQINSGTLFELTDDQGFRVLTRIGHGSEIEPVVLRVGLQP